MLSNRNMKMIMSKFGNNQYYIDYEIKEDHISGCPQQYFTGNIQYYPERKMFRETVVVYKK